MTISKNPIEYRGVSLSKYVHLENTKSVTQEKHDNIDELCQSITILAVSPDNCLDIEQDGLDDPVSLFTPDEDGDNSLHLAIIHRNRSAAIEIINNAESHPWLSDQNNLRQAPLHLAALTNQVSVVQILIRSGADVMSRDKAGNTPLMLACREEFTEVVIGILECTCSLGTTQDNNGINHLLDIRNYDGITCIHLAADRGNLGIVKILLEHGADCNAKEGKSGKTILHNACLNGNTELVRMLTKLKMCNINCKTYDGLTPFDLARARSHDTICMVLAAAGARYGYEDQDDML